MFFFEKKIESLKISDVLEITGGTVPHGIDTSITISNVATLGSAGPSDISFFSNITYVDELKKTNAGFCFVRQSFIRHLRPEVVAVIVPDPYLALQKIVKKFYGDDELTPFEKNRGKELVSPKASIAKTAKIGKNVTIHDNVVILDEAIIGDNVVIMQNAFIGERVVIGENTTIYDSCTIKFARIGAGSVIRSGVRIGSSGFGFVPDLKTGRHEAILQIAGVIIGERVDIGANSCIDRGFLGDTVIGDDTKIDNLVQIGHGAKIGKSCFFAGQVGVSGSAEIGNFVMLGGQVGILGHVKVADFVQAVPQTGVAHNIEKVGEVVAGMPAVPKTLYFKMQFLLKRLTNKNSVRNDRTE